MEHEALFWSQADALLIKPEVTRSTMMGLPCLRMNGAFFASFDRKTGDLLVKLPADRVNALVASGQGTDFAPAGRRFREWVAISPDAVESWPDYLTEALAFVGS